MRQLPGGRKCPGLVVSVRSPAEAMTALCHGAALIDVKEPSGGSLGRPAPDVADAVARVVGGNVPVSVALGELADLRIEDYEPLLRAAPIQYAKIGLAGVGKRGDWWRMWQRAWRRLPDQLGRVGVVYVDWQAAAAPRPESAIKVFADSACSAILFDTCTKDGRSLVDFAAGGQLASWTRHARSASPILVLAGSLTIGLVGSLRAYWPDYLAVRGSVCQDGRSGEICAARVRGFHDAITRTFAPIRTGEEV